MSSAVVEKKLLEALDLLAVQCRKYIDIVGPNVSNAVTDLDKEKANLCIREMVGSIASKLYCLIYSSLFLGRYREDSEDALQLQNKEEIVSEGAEAVHKDLFINRPCKASLFPNLSSVVFFSDLLL